MTSTAPARVAPGAASGSVRQVGAVRAGWALTALTGAFLAFDGVAHVLRVEAVEKAFADLGFPQGVATGIGVVELAALALYLVPRTSRLGAVLLTGYLGGAVAAQVRVQAPLVSTELFPVYLGAAAWAGLVLRDRAALALLLGRGRR
jgi:hypothetical protein